MSRNASFGGALRDIPKDGCAKETTVCQAWDINVHRTGANHSIDTPQRVDGSRYSAAVDQVFSMFKDYLEKKLDDKGKQIEQKSKID